MIGFQEAKARLMPVPGSVQIGQPVEWRLQVSHAPDTRVAVGEAQEWDRTWVLLDGPATTFDEQGFVVRWQAISLEAGLRTPPLPALRWKDQPLEVETSTLEVRGELALEEDAPRALREAPLIEAAAARHWMAWTVGALVLLTALILWWRARARRELPIRPPSAAEQLQSLREQALAGSLSARDAIYAWTRLVRSSLDARSGVDRSARTDEEWAREVGEPWVTHFARAESIKYAGGEPSRFLLSELLDAAQAHLAEPWEVAQ